MPMAKWRRAKYLHKYAVDKVNFVLSSRNTQKQDQN